MDIKENTVYCHRKLCYCAKNETTRPELKQVQMAYYKGLKDLAQNGRYDAEDFAVVIQPHMLNMEYPKDVGFFNILKSSFASNTAYYIQRYTLTPTFMVLSFLLIANKTRVGTRVVAWNAKKELKSSLPGDYWKYAS